VKKFNLFLLIINFSFASFTANAALLDFQELEAFSGSIQGIQYTNSGFQLDVLTGNEFHSFGIGDLGYTGSTALSTTGVLTETKLSQSSGGLFDLISIDLALGAPIANSIVTFTNNTGYSQIFSLTGDPFDFTPSVQNYLLDSEFLGSSFVTWTTNSNNLIQFDNIQVNNVSAVPVPAAIYLFATGLAALGLSRKKNIS